MSQKNGCECQICMGQCDMCKTQGCGMCNMCKKHNVPVCMDCATTYQNYLARLNVGATANANMGINVTFGTLLSVLFIAIIAYLIWKNKN